jgi:chromosome partitioning protein
VIVVVGNQKGGVGKTTIAIHLAAAWAKRHRVLLVDADPQQAAVAWLADPGPLEVASYTAESGLGAFLEAQAPRHDAVLVDTPPGLGAPLREALRVADLLLVPLQPSPVDVRAVRLTLELAQVLRGRKLDVRLVLSRVVTGSILGRTVREALEPYGVPVARTALTQRLVVQMAAAMGRPVFSYAADSLAADEYQQLAREMGREVFHGRHEAEDAARGAGTAGGSG